jgi:DHA2 family methylenomycin A resistance protein-like MFS transporter
MTSSPTSFARPSQPRLALVALCLAFFIVQLDVTVVNVALEAIRRDLGGGLNDQQWIVASYTIALAAGMLTAGSTGDRLGSRRICMFGLVTFAIGSAICAIAPSMHILIAARTLQGAGGAALLPCSLALIIQQFRDPRERAHALGIWGGIASVGMAAGPVVGGVLIAVAGWRSIFLVNVPFCAVTAIMMYSWVGESPRHREQKLDLAGLILGVLSLSCITGGIIETGQIGWNQPLPLLLMASGTVVGVTFVVVERRHSSPMLPLSIFASRQFTAATAAGLIFNFCLYGTLLCVSLFLQGPLALSAFKTGMLVLPLTIAVGIGATLSGRLTARFGPRAPMLIGYSLGAAGATALLVTGPSGPLPLLILGSTVLGFCSIAMPAMTSVTMSAVEPTRTGIASGVLNTARQAGGALGVAILGALLSINGPPGMSLRVPMVIVIAAYTVAIGCTLISTMRRQETRSTVRTDA